MGSSGSTTHHYAVRIKFYSVPSHLLHESCHSISKLWQAVVVLKYGSILEVLHSFNSADRSSRVLQNPLLHQIKAELIFCKTHLDNTLRIADRVKRVIFIGFPPIKIWTLFSMPISLSYF
uniref:Uncharacterized protein n=1 Tax=Opuntia streptacantha TaxID=393608 RepID=A0A7C9CQ07_OPUST